jgi:hypothetical protein
MAIIDQVKYCMLAARGRRGPVDRRRRHPRTGGRGRPDRGIRRSHERCRRCPRRLGRRCGLPVEHFVRGLRGSGGRAGRPRPRDLGTLPLLLAVAAAGNRQCRDHRRELSSRHCLST